MRMQKISPFVRAIFLFASIGSFTVAWQLTKIGASGIEDVPPPFILGAGLVGTVLLLSVVIGRFPFHGSSAAHRQHE